MGVFEEAKGKAKETAGDLVGNPDLQREGEAQANKGAEERKQTEAQSKVAAHRAKADMHEQEQKQAEQSA
jgi:uncharacterized protein YjbJ (UPF0337 family)